MAVHVGTTLRPVVLGGNNEVDPFGGIEYTLTIDGDKLTGKGSAEFGGQKQEFDIGGTREKKNQ